MNRRYTGIPLRGLRAGLSGWLVSMMVLFTLPILGQISGKVYQDFNANGTQDLTASFNEPGYRGITVTAYNSSGTQVGMTTTTANGTYSIPNVTGAVRIEFTALPSTYFSGPLGAQNASMVQFVTAPATNVNLGINYPANFCQPNPALATPCYLNGVASGNGDVFVKWPYNDSGTSGTNIKKLANQTQAGALYGVAYDRASQKLYSSSFVKRHVGLPDLNNDGKGDLANIFVTNTSTNTTTLWLDLSSLGLNFGTIANDAARGLKGLDEAANDPTAFNLVGKAGIGDIDLSDDGTILYLTNLFDKKLYAIEVATKTVKGSWTVPQTCSNNESVNFGLKYYQGNLYIGQVCTAQTTQNRADLKATVYKFDGTTFTAVLSLPLDYTKGYVFINCVGTDISKWQPWANDFSKFTICGNPPGATTLFYPQPILSDIEFDPTTDNMILGFRDRSGDQAGLNNFLLTGGLNPNGYAYEGMTGGDILAASLNANGTYTLEQNGKVGTLTGGTANGQGPGGGEFFVGEDFSNGQQLNHQEVSMGALAVRPGSQEIVQTVFDPVTGTPDSYRSGGVRFFNAQNGKAVDAFQLYQITSVGTLGKANGLGDLELLCDPAPIEIGDRVWKDLNNNGIQDPGEPPLVGVTVKLSDAAGNVWGTAITDANGQYRFSSAPGTSTASAKYGLPILPNTNYTLKITSLGNDPSVQGVGLTSVSPVIGETANATNTGTTIHNSDAFVVAGFPTIYLKTGVAGANNHSYDFGLKSLVFDLALRKQLSVGQVATLTPGSTVTFTITIFNQGTLNATNVQVTDYVPSGLTLNDPNWTLVGSKATLKTPIATLAAGESTTRTISFIIGANTTGSITNLAEISSAVGGTDIDSNLDNDSTNDKNTKNDEIGENGKSGGDEDDSDYETITIKCPEGCVPVNTVVQP